MTPRASGKFDGKLNPQPPYECPGCEGPGRLAITMVRDSGTGDLTGLSGWMTNDIINGRYLYRFEYALGAVEDDGGST